MLQEIITYIIVGVALAMAISRMAKKLSPKKKTVKKIEIQKDSISMQHNCSDCSAECMLRNAVKPISETTNKELCKKIDIK